MASARFVSQDQLFEEGVKIKLMDLPATFELIAKLSATDLKLAVTLHVSLTTASSTPATNLPL